MRALRCREVCVSRLLETLEASAVLLAVAKRAGVSSDSVKDVVRAVAELSDRDRQRLIGALFPAPVRGIDP
jgi:hypothetical protein